MLPDKLAFVDIETTGGRTFYDRIIEIGILRIENNTVVKTFQTLLNPQAYLPKEFTMLTGIIAGDLENAPTFREIKDEIAQLLNGCLFVAHNARFDYSFIKNEFQRQQQTFVARQLCTVKLSRLLYPHWRHHDLDSIIKHCQFTCQNRHRAFDDAKVLSEFYQKIQTEFSRETLEMAVNKCLKKPSLPIKLKTEDIEKLPECPGVYIFYGTKEQSKQSNFPAIPLYVGKSKNIRERVLSHFASDIRKSTEMNIAQQIEHIETVPTAGELGALLLESQLIKKLLPIYNKKSRLKRELVAVKSRTQSAGYQEIYLEPVSVIVPDELPSFLGFFRSRRQAKSALADLAKRHTLCEKFLGLEKTSGACFAYRLEHCKGACIGLEKPAIYNLRVTKAFAHLKISTWPFEGAVLFSEENLKGEKQYLLIDKWCYLGSVFVDAQGNQKEELFGHNSMFDLDVYQIIKRYLGTMKIHARVLPASTRDLVLASLPEYSTHPRTRQFL